MENTYQPPLHRRIFQRFEVDAEATLEFDNGTKRLFLLRDISNGGAGIVSTSPLNVNEQAKFEAHIPFFFKEPFYSRGRVVWCKERQPGVWYAGLEFDRESRINLNG